jgi:hypothetical protein
MFRIATVTVLTAVFVLVLLPIGNTGSAAVAASPSVPSSVSVYLNCSAGLSFVPPGAASSCGSGNYTGTYSGVDQMAVSNLTSVFYLAAATGGVKVTFNLTDVTRGQPLLSGVGYGSISGGSCTSPNLVHSTTINVTSNVISSGDKVEASLSTIFTGTGTPAFCSGGVDGTFITIGTSVVGVTQPSLTTLLTAGSPQQTTLSGFNGVAESYVDSGSSGLSVVVMGVVTNSAGSTIDVIVTSVTVSPGSSATAFLKFNQYPSGTYTVTVIAVTSSNVPVSTVEETTATV